MPSASFLIYSGCMPLLKIYIATFFGFLLAKKGLFPPAASRGASQVSMNLSLPCLIFANVVPAFTPTNVSAIGPLMLLAFSYQGIGFGIALILRELMYIPRNFWQGFVILVGMSNWGNLPSAVVMSVTTQAPFDPSTDPGLGLSFVSIFIVSYHITFWAFGAAASLAWDYAPHVPQREAAEKRVRWCQKPIGGWVARNLLKMNVEDPWASEHVQLSEINSDAKDMETGPVIQMTSMDENPTAVNTIVAELELSRQVSRTAVPIDSKISPGPQPKSSPSTHHSRLHLALVQQILRPLKAAANSITITLVVSLIVSLVQPLKALFVDISHQGGPKWHGPDGRPPLAFVIDTASFIGGICIPLSLILLGASFARLRIPRPFGRLPIRAMFAAALSKMVVLPVIGVLIVSRMTQNGMMSRKAVAERFVAMFLSGTPAAVNQMIVASLYSVDGDVDTLSAFLLVQYVLMFFTSAALTAVALALL